MIFGANSAPSKGEQQPPAYTEDPSPSGSSSLSREPPLPPSKHDSYAFSKLSKVSTDTTATVSQMHMHSRREPITGTFYIDPKYPSYGFEIKDDDNCKHYKNNPPDASFRTRKAAIDMELATTGEMTEAKPKVRVLVGSRAGNINVKLLSTPLTCPRLGLEVIARKGDIVLMLPNDFFGCIELKTRKGSLQFLPALASSMRTIKKSNDEALIMVGQQTSNKEVDFVQLMTRFGKIVVGIDGLDRFQQSSGSFWNRLMGSNE